MSTRSIEEDDPDNDNKGTLVITIRTPAKKKVSFVNYTDNKLRFFAEYEDVDSMKYIIAPGNSKLGKRHKELDTNGGLDKYQEIQFYIHKNISIQQGDFIKVVEVEEEKK